MKLWQKTLLAMISSIVLLVILVFTTIGIYFYYIAVQKNDKSFLQKSLGFVEIDSGDTVEDRNEIYKEMEEGASWVEKRNHEKWRIRSRDGLVLVGYYIPSKEPTKKV